MSALNRGRFSHVVCDTLGGHVASAAGVEPTRLLSPKLMFDVCASTWSSIRA